MRLQIHRCLAAAFLLGLGVRVQVAAGAGGPGSYESLYPGDTVSIRISEELNSGRNEAGTRFRGIVDIAVVHSGKQLVPKGALVEGYIRQAATSGWLAGRSELHLHLDSLSVNGRRYTVTTQPEIRTGPARKRHNVTYIGGGAAVGTIVGAIAGGGKGAAIGAASGAVGGGAGAALTGRKEVLIPAETVLTFRLRDQLILD